MLIFALPEAGIKAYISYDPILMGVSGYQRSSDLISEEMIENMTKDMMDFDSNSMGLSKGHRCDEDMATFLYGYSEYMEECEGGEIAEGTMAVTVYFH